jgi:hypothetical protein
MSLFLPNIPQSSDNLDFSQGQLLSNNQGLDTVFGIDHTLFSDSTANKGKHKKSTYFAQAASPGTSASESAIYSKTAGTGTNEIYIQKESTAPAGSDIQLTLFSKGVATLQTGYSWLPGGILIQWIQDSGTNNTAKNFPIAFPNACWNVQLTKVSSSTSSIVGHNGFTTTQFTLITNAVGAITYNMIAIGN